MIVGVRDEQIANAVNRHAARIIQLGAARLSAVARETAGARAQESSDQPVAGYLPKAGSAVKEQRAGVVDGQAPPSQTGVCYRRDRSTGRHFADLLVPIINKEQI